MSAKARCKHPEDRVEVLIAYEWCTVCGALMPIVAGQRTEWTLLAMPPPQAKELDKLVDRYRSEYEMSYAAVVGVLQMKIHLLCDEAKERGEEVA